MSKGIPFAQPRPGTALAGTDAGEDLDGGTRHYRFAVPCIQGGVNSSEDCLYLKIWTPDWPAESRKAVMVWLHGGEEFAGAASDPVLMVKVLPIRVRTHENRRAG